MIALMSTSSFAAKGKGKKAPPPPMDPKQAEMMKAWHDYATPGAPHKVLAQMAGQWKYDSKMWEAPDQKPHESKGSGGMKMILGGRWLQMDAKGKAMGIPFQGLGFIGYDNLKGKYESTWIDSMGTGTMHGTGDYDASTKTLSDSGQMSCPMSKDKVTSYRSEWKIVDKNNLMFTMWGPNPADGKEMKMMEMHYKRAK
jgi:hypothetical protein